MKYFSEQIGVMAIMLLLASSVIPLGVDYSAQMAAVSATQCRVYQNKKCSNECKGKVGVCRTCCECKGMMANRNNTGCVSRGTAQTQNNIPRTTCTFVDDKVVCTESRGQGDVPPQGGTGTPQTPGGNGTGSTRDCRATGCSSGRECRWTLFEGYQCILPPIMIGH